MSDYAWIRRQIGEPTIANAARFMRRWYHEDGQLMPGGWLMSLRAMAYHASCVLDGHATDPRPDDYLACYLETPHGPTLYWLALDRPGDPIDARHEMPLRVTAG